jgi:hypothetical protein
VAETTVLFIESPDGQRFECEVPPDTKLSRLAAEFFEERRYRPTQDASGRLQRAVIDLIDPNNPDHSTRLRGEDSVEEADLSNGSVLRIYPESVAGCFLSGVPVLLADGSSKAIEDISVGDLLLSGHPRSVGVEATRVRRVFTGLASSYLLVNQCLRVTGTHPVWRKGGWAAAADLRVGDELQDVYGKPVPIHSVEHVARIASIYNLEVEARNHTFFANGILVHNMLAKQALSSLFAEVESVLDSTAQEEQLRELQTQIDLIGAQLTEIEVLKERVDLLEHRWDQFGDAFERLGGAMRSIQFIRRPNVQRRTIATIHIDSTAAEFDSERQRRLIENIGKHTHAEVSQIRLLSLESGSVLVTLEMPEDAALNLMRLYLSGSPIIAEMRIQKVELRPVLVASKINQSGLPPSSLPKIRILFLAANPKDTPELRLAEEVRSIEQALRLAEFRDRFEIFQYWATRTIDIQSCFLRYKPHLVHFSGHGSSAGEIILEDVNGYSAPVSARALASLFRVLHDEIRCVILNACYSHQQAMAIADEVDCVVGMTDGINDASAIAFATSFYQALGYGRDVKAAYELGCVQVDIEALEDQDVPKLLSVKADPSKVSFTN